MSKSKHGASVLVNLQIQQSLSDHPRRNNYLQGHDAAPDNISTGLLMIFTTFIHASVHSMLISDEK